MRRRFVATTDSNHDGPIFPNRAADQVVDGPNQLWVADITEIPSANALLAIQQEEEAMSLHPEPIGDPG